MKLTVLLVVLALLALAQQNLVRSKGTHFQTDTWSGTESSDCDIYCRKIGGRVCGTGFRECCRTSCSGWVIEWCPNENQNMGLDCSMIHSADKSRWGGTACNTECKQDYKGIVCEGTAFNRCCKTGCSNDKTSICQDDAAYDIEDCGRYP